MLKLSRSPVVVAFDKVDCPAGQPLSIGNYAFWSSQAEIPEKIKNIAWLGASVNTLADYIVHLLRIRKRAIAAPAPQGHSHVLKRGMVRDQMQSLCTRSGGFQARGRSDTRSHSYTRRQTRH